MMKRIVLSSLSSLTLMFGAAGCADMPESEVELTTAANTLCPAVYEPVCGKDGMTYSNVCEAGGRRNVAYEGECIDACISATCPEGTECSTDRNGNAVCTPIAVDPCLSTTCPEGTVCSTNNNGNASCEPIDPCMLVRCGADAPTCVVRGNKAVCI